MNKLLLLFACSLILVTTIVGHCIAQDLSGDAESLSFGSELSQLDDSTLGEELGLDDEEDAPPTLKGKIEFSFIGRDVNEEARNNPRNEISDYKEFRQILESSLTLSDYLNESETLGWLIKLYGYRLYEQEVENSDDADEQRFDEVYVDWSTDDWFVSLGKRRTTWGPSLAFNPVNVVVPPKDPLSPDQATEGHPVFLVSFATDMTTLELIATRDYDRNWTSEYARWGVRAALILEESDFNLYYFDGESDKDDNDYNRLAGFSYSSNFLSDATLYLEIANFLHNDRNYYDENGNQLSKDESVNKAVLGSNITIDGNTSLLIEVYRNTAGYTEKERENFFLKVDSIVSPVFDPTQASVLSDQEFGEMNQTYLLVSYRKSDILEKFGINLQLLAAEDRSSIAELEFDYNMTDYYKLIFNLKAYNGDENSEFGNSEVNSKATLTISASF